MMRTIISLGLFAVLAVSPVQALVDKDFYKVNVPVASQSGTDRSAAFQQAAAQMLVKITGSTVIMQLPQTQEIAQQAAKYVRQFRYGEQTPPDQTKSMKTDKADRELPFIISVTFNGEALERALIAAGLPVWGADRPPLLVLAGVQEGSQRLILSAQTVHPVKEALEKAAAARGVPLVFPLMDQKERKQLDFNAIRGGLTETLLKSAERYHAPLVLEAYLEADPVGDWSTRWAVHRDAASSRWHEPYMALEEAVQSGIGGAADILASRYAIASTADSTSLDVLLQVDQLKGFNDYATVLNYLDGLIFIENVVPTRVQSGSVVFRILMRSELVELERILGVSGILQPAVATDSTPVAAGAYDHIDLFYSYRKH
ncbi:MAG TPA: DUF2066 domain-containing protein [Gammaproteobacteria bacterium]